MKIARCLALYQWRIVARFMMWLYRRELPWRQIPLLLLMFGVLMGGVTALLLNLG